MTIEVRQMVIKSTVGDDRGASERPGEGGGEGIDVQRLREEILAEIQEVVALKLRDMAER